MAWSNRRTPTPRPRRRLLTETPNSAAEARFLVVGTKAKAEVAHYPDIGLKVQIGGGSARFLHEDGRPFVPDGQ